MRHNKTRRLVSDERGIGSVSESSHGSSSGRAVGDGGGGRVQSLPRCGECLDEPPVSGRREGAASRPGLRAADLGLDGGPAPGEHVLPLKPAPPAAAPVWLGRR